jgi:hypothetical protein
VKTYTYGLTEYVKSGDVRSPMIGEVYLDGVFNTPRYCAMYGVSPREILSPKEERVESEEYNIPVLVKADIKANPGDDRENRYRGKVIMCRKPSLCYYGPKESAHIYGMVVNWRPDEVIPYPTREQVEAAQAKLKAKADPLPRPVRAALDAADLGCRRDGVEKLVEAIFTHLPKGA